MNYNYDEESDRVQPLEELTLSVRDIGDDQPFVFTPDGISSPDIRTVGNGSSTEIVLTNVGLYTLIGF